MRWCYQLILIQGVLDRRAILSIHDTCCEYCGDAMFITLRVSRTFARGSLFVPIRLRNIIDFTGTHTLYIEETLNTSIFLHSKLLLILNLWIAQVLNLKILFFGLKFGKSIYNSLINAYVTDYITVQRCCVRPKTGLYVQINFILEWISYRMPSKVNPF